MASEELTSGTTLRVLQAEKAARVRVVASRTASNLFFANFIRIPRFRYKERRPHHVDVARPFCGFGDLGVRS